MTTHDPAAGPNSDAIPRFCPRCGAGAKPGTDPELCPQCGDRLANQGYCPTCEDFWKLHAGYPCPKHEVELLDDPPRDEFIGDRSKLVTVATYPHPNQANAPRIRLEAEGIPTFLDGERMAGNIYYQVATGGVRLMVPADLASQARILIDQTWAPAKPEDDTEDAWDDLAPEPGEKRRTVLKAAILLVLFGPLVAYALTALGWLLRRVP
ncbi:hypothetical protein TA3x_004288 [Tundrisphaera sp. TA3]|uniref:hypothetical protein n=1 Tax=Tundrisphaera sp. TA3 TaxID=3435775 RepID=UPI003EBAC603